MLHYQQKNNIKLTETIYIVDSDGDLPLLKNVCLATAPANASQKVQEIVQPAPSLTCSAEQLILSGRSGLTRRVRRDIL